MIVYKFRMYPTRKQEELLDNNLDVCRKLYNRILCKISEEKKKGHSLSMSETQKLIPKWKNTDPELNTVYSKVLQMVNYTLWSNIRALSKAKKNNAQIGKLRFKGQGWYKNLNFN